MFGSVDTTHPDGLGGSCLLSFGGVDEQPNAARAVAAIGSIATARSVVVLVPGTSTTIGNLGGVVEEASRVQSLAGPGVAAIAWLDYNAPEIDFSVASGGRADSGGERLASFLQGFVGKRLVVSGHSYGALVASKALRDYGAKSIVSDVVFLGAPGVKADGAASFSPSRVWIGAADADPVLRFASHSVHGSAPHSGNFGGFRFDTGSATGHSSYYARGTESLENVARIASGRYDSVTAHS